MSAEEEIRLGERAAALLSDEVLLLAWKTIEDRVLQAWRNSAATDTETREKSWFVIKQIDATKIQLEGMVNAGRFASDRVNAENTRRDTERKAKEQTAADLGIPVSMIED